MRKVIESLQRWCDGNSILIVTVSGLLTRLYCPFTVECMESLRMLKKGRKYTVTKVGVDARLHLVYIIANRAYSYKYFRIIGRAA